jgi:hypothetical protein
MAAADAAAELRAAEFERQQKLAEIAERERIEHEENLADQEAIRAAGEERRRAASVQAGLQQALERQMRLAAEREQARLAAWQERENARIAEEQRIAAIEAQEAEAERLRQEAAQAEADRLKAIANEVER